MNIGKAIVYLEHIKPDDFNLDEQQTWNRLKAIQCLIQQVINQQEIIDKAIDLLNAYIGVLDDTSDLYFENVKSILEIGKEK